MTVPSKGTGALVNKVLPWQSIDWKFVRAGVRKLQMRIAKAVKEGKV